MTAASPPNDEIRAGWKLAWLETIADDQSVTGLSLKVAVKLSQRAERDGVVRTASQQWIAKRIGTTERAVRRCIDLLRKLGHIAKCGEGARGRAAEYRLVKASNTRPQLPGLHGPVDTRTPRSATPDAAVRKCAPGSPPLPSFQEDSLPHPGAHAQICAASELREGAEQQPSDMSSPDRCWRAIKERLARSKHFGKDQVASWLSKLEVGSIDQGKVTMLAPTKFIADRSAIDHSEMLLHEWQAIDPAIKRVTFMHATLPQSAVTPTAEASEVLKVVPIRERLKAKRDAAGKVA